jgi:hypothetical protein
MLWEPLIEEIAMKKKKAIRFLLSLIDRADEYAPECDWLTRDESKRLDRVRKQVQRKRRTKKRP